MILLVVSQRFCFRKRQTWLVLDRV